MTKALYIITFGKDSGAFAPVAITVRDEKSDPALIAADLLKNPRRERYEATKWFVNERFASKAALELDHRARQSWSSRLEWRFDERIDFMHGSAPITLAPSRRRIRLDS